MNFLHEHNIISLKDRHPFPQNHQWRRNNQSFLIAPYITSLCILKKIQRQSQSSAVLSRYTIIRILQKLSAWLNRTFFFTLHCFVKGDGVDFFFFYYFNPVQLMRPEQIFFVVSIFYEYFFYLQINQAAAGIIIDLIVFIFFLSSEKCWKQKKKKKKKLGWFDVRVMNL